MSRDIKFRAWDKKDKELAEVVNINYIESTISVKNEKREFWTGNQTDFEIMQYTGMRDKNSVEIYEGDIVNYEDYEIKDTGGIYRRPIRGVVEFLEGGWIVDDEKNQQAAFIWSETAEIERVGNIYENPELLDQA